MKGLYRRSWTSLPTPFISEQRLSELPLPCVTRTGGEVGKVAVSRELIENLRNENGNGFRALGSSTRSTCCSSWQLSSLLHSELIVS